MWCDLLDQGIILYVKPVNYMGVCPVLKSLRLGPLSQTFHFCSALEKLHARDCRVDQGEAGLFQVLNIFKLIFNIISFFHSYMIWGYWNIFSLSITYGCSPADCCYLSRSGNACCTEEQVRDTPQRLREGISYQCEEAWHRLWVLQMTRNACWCWWIIELLLTSVNSLCHMQNAATGGSASW